HQTVLSDLHGEKTRVAGRPCHYANVRLLVKHLGNDIGRVFDPYRKRKSFEPTLEFSEHWKHVHCAILANSKAAVHVVANTLKDSIDALNCLTKACCRVKQCFADGCEADPPARPLEQGSSHQPLKRAHLSRKCRLADAA